MAAAFLPPGGERAGARANACKRLIGNGFRARAAALAQPFYHRGSLFIPVVSALL
jgi:hypothetical protein